MSDIATEYRGRFAPSPTGPLHLGSLTIALASWLEARKAGGTWLVRMDDLDPPREVPGAADTILRQLERLGLHPDAPVHYQSRRGDAYAAAVEQLIAAGHAFHCRLSRRELKRLGNRHPGAEVAVPPGPDQTLRMAVADEQLNFDDLFQGRCHANLEEEGGAFVIRRRDGLFAYQLACALDEADQGISHVVRGADLLASTFRQRLVLDRLGRSAPVYGHLPVLRDGAGRKLSKSEGAAAIDTDNPARALHTALVLLDQRPPADIARAPVDTALAWAREHWNPSVLHGRLDIDVATTVEPRQR